MTRHPRNYAEIVRELATHMERIRDYRYVHEERDPDPAITASQRCLRAARCLTELADYFVVVSDELRTQQRFEAASRQEALKQTVGELACVRETSQIPCISCRLRGLVGLAIQAGCSPLRK
jgi:uncharacterized linocin/CFP29 family protein